MLSPPVVCDLRWKILEGVSGIVPAPWEAGSMNGQVMEWELIEIIFDSGPLGLNGAFDYNNWNVNTIINDTEYRSSEVHQFFWQD